MQRGIIPPFSTIYSRIMPASRNFHYSGNYAGIIATSLVHTFGCFAYGQKAVIPTLTPCEIWVLYPLVVDAIRLKRELAFD